MVGPFIFFDHMGPASLPPGKGIDVRPHPHIGLATVTYLFEGEIIHRDSLGFAQPIRPGEVNLMTAGRGIAHSERSGDDRETASTLQGIQSWTALPNDREEMEPAFTHHPSASLPGVDMDGAEVRVIIGTAYGQTSPVASYSPTLYLEVRLPQGAEFKLPDEYEERAVYVVSGRVEIGKQMQHEGVMVVVAPDIVAPVRAQTAAHVMVLGGAPVGARHIWWNFVSSSAERIEQAKLDWVNDRFAKVPGETEFIPLPA